MLCRAGVPHARGIRRPFVAGADGRAGQSTWRTYSASPVTTAAVVALVGATKLAPCEPQTIDGVPRRWAAATDAS